MRINYRHSEETKRKIALAKKGKRFSAEHIKNLSLAHLGQVGYWTGKKRGPMAQEIKNKIRLSNIGSHTNFTNFRRGEKNNKWKGNQIKYGGIHDYIHYYFGKANKCENLNCSGISKNYQWSLIKSKKYERKRENFRMLCVSCHKKYDLNESDI